MDAAILELRTRHVCSTDAPAILGLGRRSALDVWTEKIGLGSSVVPNDRMRWGLRLEDTIAAAYAEDTGRPVEKWAQPFVTRDGLGYPAGCSPDRLTVIDGVETVLELKSTAWKIETLDDVPLEWLAQVGHQMLVLDRPVAGLAIFTMRNGPELRTFELERREKFDAWLQEESASFWRLVESRTPPAPDGKRGSIEALKRLYPVEKSGSVVSLAGGLGRWADQLEDAKQRRKQAERDEMEAKAEIMAALGDAEKGILPDGRIFTLKTMKASEYVVHREATRVLRRAKR